MASITYNQIFSNFLGRIKDYALMSLDEDDAVVQMTEWLHKALAKSYIRRVFSSLTIDDDTQTIEFTMKTSTSDEEDSLFIEDVIAKSMVVEWLDPQLKRTSTLAQMFGGKEQKFYSQAAHLEELRNLYEDSRIEVRKMLRDRGYVYNPYLNVEV